MKKKKLIIIVSIICVVAFVCLVKYSNKTNENDTEVISNFEKETISERRWQDDAENHEITVFMNSYRNYPINDLYQVISNYLTKEDYENNLFFKKYIEEYEKIDLEVLNDKEAEFLSMYTVLLFNEKFDYNNSTIEDIWSYNYEIDGSLNSEKKETLSSYRGFILKIDVQGEKNIILCDETYKFNGYSKTYYTGGNSKVYSVNVFENRYGSLNKNGGTLSGTDTIYYDKSGIKYTVENKDTYIGLVQKYQTFFDFINEYTDIYWQHYSDTVSDINVSEKNKPRVGMSKSEVLATDWGNPNKKNVDTYSWGTTEQWVYDKYGYVYFKNDIVTSVSER